MRLKAMQNSNLETILQRLTQDQRLLDELRRDYVTIRKSRFYAIHAMWAGIKQIFTGAFLFPGDTSLPAADDRAAQAPEILLPLENLLARLADGWKWRNEQHPLSATPAVSIVIPVYNQIRTTITCLQSIVDTWFESLAVQIVLVDDASNDETIEFAKCLPGLTYLRNDTNLGFLLSCNRGAQLAKGKYICFLNNDTAVTNGWLDELVVTADSDEAIGAVGSKLLFADGRLQEAGGIIWQDASGWNYGRGDDANDARYNYTRDVDYCSGASLLVRADIFRKLGGFSEEFVPAYFEDTDLCFSLRKHGFRVLYQPKSIVVHYEGVTSGRSTETGTKRFQELNRPKFIAKWSDDLERHLENDPGSGLRGARRLGRAKTLLMIDNYVPEFDKDSGSNKLFNIIKQFQGIGYDVIYAPDNYHRSEPYTSILQRLGVEVLYRSSKQPSLQQSVQERLPLVDLIWIGRPEIAEKWIPIVRRHACDVPVVYDTHDLHFVRRKRELEIKGIADSEQWHQWQQEKERELAVIRAADVPITVSDVERCLLAQEERIETAFVIPNVHELRERTCGYEDTEGILFIGGYAHEPNVDAAVFLCERIMPLVWEAQPDIIVTLLGTNPPATLRRLACERVIVPGYIHDVDPYFERARVFAAPLRYGAGLKGKIGHAFSFRVPTVTTQIGAEGFNIEDELHAIVANDPRRFAESLVRVYLDPALWHRLSRGGAACVEQYGPEQTRARLRALAALAHDRRRSATATYPVAPSTSGRHRVRIES
jgi:GT2 family glycosyltransferase